jgi:hypothetical protein
MSQSFVMIYLPLLDFMQNKNNEWVVLLDVWLEVNLTLITAIQILEYNSALFSCEYWHFILA